MEKAEIMLCYNNVMSKQNFTIGFDGVALQNHQIDAVDLAIALTGLSELLDIANQALNHKDAKLKLQVKSTSNGSFNIFLELSQTLSGLFHGKSVKDILHIIGLIKVELEETGSIGGGIVTLISLYRWLQGKKIVKQEEKENSIVLYTEIENVRVLKEVATLYQITEIRKSIAVMLSPLNKDGIEEFYTKQNTDTEKHERITKSEIDAFAYTEPSTREVLFDESESIITCKIIGIMFEENLKWRLADGNNKFFANVEDKVFLEKIENREISFAKGDLLKADFEVKTFTTKDSIRKEYRVLKVIELIPPPEQINLF